MRKPGYYWAKRRNHNEQIVEISNSGRVWITATEQYFCEADFEWISDTPIGVEKMPVNLLHDHYYVIQTPTKASLVARWDSNHGLFCSTKCLVGGGLIDRYSTGCVEILSGPFSVEQLTKLKPELP
jgi:hypothetical protein